MGIPARTLKPGGKHACPNCRTELVHVPVHGRASLLCPQRHGQALASSTLRAWLLPEFQEDFERALSLRRPAKRACPRCRSPFSLARFHGLPVEQCADCSLVWVHEALLERLPLRPERERARAREARLPVELRFEAAPAATPFEGLGRERCFPFATLALLASFCLVTVAFLLSGESEVFVAYPREPLRLFGVPLLLSLFTHAGPAHLLGNGYFLFLAGSVLEASLGWKKLVQLFLLCGLAGTAGSAFVSGDGGIGASGAICGLLTALVATNPKAFYVFRSGGLFFGVPGLPGLLNLSLRVPLWLWAFFWFSFDLYGAGEQLRGGGDGVGHGAHLGGAVAGALLAGLPWFQSAPGSRRRQPGLS